MRIAVVGAGVAGLTAARMLHREHEIVVYEAGARTGGHANTVTIDDPRGPVDVDTGFIVLNDRNYPNFTRLLDQIGVRTVPSKMGMSMADEHGDFEFAYTRKGLFAQRSNLLRPRFYRLIADFVRFSREVRPLAGRPDAPPIGEYLRDSGYSEWFIERAMLPQVSGVWSTGMGDSREFPVGFLAEFLQNHGQLSLGRRPAWRTIPGGSRTYVDTLCEPFADRIRTAAPVSRIERAAAGVAVTARGCETELFDEVVVAAHSDQALAMLANPNEAERGVLGAMRFQPNEAVLHEDSSLMPKRRRAWSSWNFHLLDRPVEGSAITYWMNNLQRLETDRQLFVTLNLTDRIDPERIRAVIPYAHPIMTMESAAAQRRWHEVSGRDRIHYCGAYWRWGFHEDGCWSGIRAVAPLLAAAEAPLELERAA